MVNVSREVKRERYSIEHVIAGIKKFMGHLKDAIKYLENLKEIEMLPDSKIDPMKYKRPRTQNLRASVHHLTKAKQIEIMIEIYDRVLKRSSNQLIQVFKATGHNDKEFQLAILMDCEVLITFLGNMNTLLEKAIAKLESFQETSMIDIGQLNNIINDLNDRYNHCDKYLKSFNYVLRVENAYLRRR